MSATRMEIYEDAASEWRWRVRAGNGEIVAQSEGYTTKADAKRGAETMRHLASTAESAEGIEIVEADE